MNILPQQELEHSLNVLSVDQSDSWDDIERQYRQLIQQWHPDRKSDDDQEFAKQKFIEINTAFKNIRQHYRKNGQVPRPVKAQAQAGPLLGTKKQTAVKKSLFKNKVFIGIAVSFAIVAVFAATLWSLDSRLAENNRDRAKVEKEDTVIDGPVQPSVSQFTLEEKIQQSSNDVEP